MDTKTSTHNPSSNQTHHLVEMAMHSLDLGVIAVDQDARITFSNAEARLILPNVIETRILGDSLQPIDADADWQTIISSTHNSQNISSLRCKITGSNGFSDRMLNVKCMPLNNPTSQSTGALITIQEEKRYEIGSHDEHDVLQRLATLGKLTSSVAHELNNPLDGILRYTNLALRLANVKDDAKLKQYLQESRIGIKRMVNIISDLLAYSRTSTKDFDISNINEIVEQATKSISEIVNDCRLKTSLDLNPENMPSVCGSQLYQVCCNIVKNAYDAMPTGGQLVVKTNIECNHVVIRFADTGTGLHGDLREIFHPFVTTKALGNGTGLGLAICKDFVEAMNGTITAESNQPQGAIFTIRIPLAGCVTTQGAKEAL